MARRSKLPPDLTPLDGWTKHDGGPCPIERGHYAKIMVAMGMRTTFIDAAEWAEFDEDCWHWKSRIGAPAGMDIVAYFAEDEPRIVTVPRLYMSIPASEQGFDVE